MPRLVPLLLTVALVAASAGPALAATEGSPVLSVHLPDNHVEEGEPARLDLYLLNGRNVTEGGPPDEEQAVTTARNVTVTLEAGEAPLEVETATQPVGTVPEGRVGPIPFAIAVDEDAAPGTYRLPVTVRYNYTAEVDSTDPANPEYEVVETTLDRTVRVVVEDRAGFSVASVTADLAVGETGPLELSLENVGGINVTGASVVVQSEDPAFTFGGSPTATVFVGEWAAGEERAVSVTADVVTGADARSYPLSVSVTYRDPDGDRRQSEADTVGAVPRTEQSFGLANVSSTLAVGDEGTLRATLTNQGPTTVRNAVVVFSAQNANVVPVETEYAVGDLGPGESATFAFDAEVAESADAGPRQLSFEVRYRDAADDVRRSDPLDARVEVGPKRDVFEVVPVTAAQDAGTSGELVLRVTNAGDEPVTDVSAKLFADDPLSSTDDEAFIDALGPGESTTVRFALAVGPGALEKTYPVSVDFQYDDAEGDTRLSDTYDVPVAVNERSTGGGPGLVQYGVGGGLVLLVGAGLWLWRRR